ncbi:MAG: GNAT family protein [Chloroflexota bacterium]
MFNLLRDQWAGIASPEFEYRLDEKTVLRPLMAHHADHLFACVDTHRDNLREWVAWVDNHTSITDSEEYIDRAMKKYGAFIGLDCGIWHNGQFCGQVSYNDWIVKRQTGDIGYWLAPPFRGKGIMTKAVRAMLDYGFTALGLHRITLYTAVENTRSTALAKRIGFTHEGVLRRGERIRNTFHDANVFSILSSDGDTD